MITGYLWVEESTNGRGVKRSLRVDSPDEVIMEGPRDTLATSVTITFPVGSPVRDNHYIGFNAVSLISWYFLLEDDIYLYYISRIKGQFAFEGCWCQNGFLISIWLANMRSSWPIIGSLTNSLAKNVSKDGDDEVALAVIMATNSAGEVENNSVRQWFNIPCNMQLMICAFSTLIQFSCLLTFKKSALFYSYLMVKHIIASCKHCYKEKYRRVRVGVNTL